MQTATDVLKTALFNEVKAGAFYQKAAEMTKNDNSRMIFLELANMEDDHATELIRKTEGQPCTQGFDPEAYLRELERSIELTLTVQETELLENGDMRAILELAIAMEGKARDTYLNLASQASSDEVRAFCKGMAKEEDSHVRRIETLLTSLDMDEDDRPGL